MIHTWSHTSFGLGPDSHNSKVPIPCGTIIYQALECTPVYSKQSSTISIECQHQISCVPPLLELYSFILQNDAWSAFWYGRWVGDHTFWQMCKLGHLINYTCKQEKSVAELLQNLCSCYQCSTRTACKLCVRIWTPRQLDQSSGTSTMPFHHPPHLSLLSLGNEDFFPA
jgi:hypothetical protein